MRLAAFYCIAMLTWAQQTYEQSGIAVSFELAPLEGGKGLQAGKFAEAIVSVRDARTGEPAGGLRPESWLLARRSALVAEETSCSDKVRSLRPGFVSVRPDADLNSSVLLILNGDNTVSFVNPRVGLSKTHVESQVLLPSQGMDWALSPDQKLLFVTMPERGEIAVIDTVLRKALTAIAVGKNPVRIAMQPDGKAAWIGLDGSPYVVAIDVARRRVVTTLEAGEGLHTLAFTPDSRLLLVTNSSSDNVSVIDTKQTRKVATVAVGTTPVAIAYGPASRLLYVGALNGGGVSVIDPLTLKVARTIPLERGVVALRADPKGRYLWAVNQLTSKVTVIDTANHSVLAEATVGDEPDQIAFTEQFAYVRNTKTVNVSLIGLDGIEKGNPKRIDVQGGSAAPNEAHGGAGVADMIVPNPSGGGVYLANAGDGNAYRYLEGQMAVADTFKSAGRFPRGLLTIDRGLREIAPGTYRTTIQLPYGGAYDVPFFIDKPRVVSCFRVEIEGKTGEQVKREATRLAARVVAEAPLVAGAAGRLRLEVRDGEGRLLGGLRDLQVLLFEPPGVWQRRLTSKQSGEGVYEVEQKFPHAGVFRVLVSSASRGVQRPVMAGDVNVAAGQAGVE